MEIIGKARKLVAEAKADYCDFRFASAPFTRVMVKDGEVEADAGKSTGFSFRVLKKGSWGFAAANQEKELEKTLRKAERLAGLSKGSTSLSEEKQVKARVNAKYRRNVLDVGVEEKIRDLRELEKGVRLKGISNSTVSYSDVLLTNFFLNSEGSGIEVQESRVYVSLNAIARKAGELGSGSERLGVKGGYEAVGECFGKAPLAGEKALRALEAKRVKQGVYTVIVDGEMAGVMAHEAVGHACEADGVMAQDSILEGKTGQEIAGGNITIVDDATRDFFGSYAFDSEGVKAQKKVLVEKGVLKGFLHSRETGARFGVKSTGSARAMGYASIPIVRMSNTFFGKGDAKKEELFEVKNALYVKGMRGGQVIPKNGTYVFTAEEGFLVENGEVKQAVRDVLITGMILETLKKVDAVADDFSASPGMCGKAGQSVPVSDGGPHLRIKEMRIGGV